MKPPHQPALTILLLYYTGGTANYSLTPVHETTQLRECKCVDVLRMSLAIFISTLVQSVSLPIRLDVEMKITNVVRKK